MAAAGLGAVLVLLYQRRPAGGSSESPFRVLGGWLLDRWRRDRLASLAAPPLIFAALMASFNAFKQLILVDAGFRYDALFADIDRLLFLGVDPWRVSHALFASPTATWLIDSAYHGWFLPMSLGVMLCAFLPGSAFRARTQYMLSYIFVWIGLGSVLAWLLPAAGPCFHGELVGPSPSFDALLAELAADERLAGGTLNAFTSQARLLEAQGMDVLLAGGGISAMPSVHNALAVLFVLAGFRIHRLLGWVMVGYATLIWIGSIHLGWHYAIDGIVAAVLTYGIWLGSGRIADWLASPNAPLATGLTPAES